MAQTGYTPISIYYSSTATNVPTAGNLVAGELAINTADGKLFYKDSSGVVQVIGTKGGVGSSSNTQVLYNSSGTIAGSANFTWNGSSLGLTGTTSAVTTAITATTGAPYTSYTNTGSSFFVGKENSAGGSFGTTAYASLLYEGGAYPMVFFTNATERMRITSGGDVIVGGTTAPLSSSGRGLITINGSSSSALSFTTAGANKAYIYCDGTNLDINNQANGYMTFDTNAIERMRIDTSGNLSVGATSGTGRINLAVSSGGAWFSSKSGSFSENLFGSDGSGNASIYTTGGTNTILLYTSGTERMRIDSIGRVMIGTTSGAAGLTVYNYGSQWTGATVNTYTAPAGNVFIQTGAIASQDNWIGFTGNYGTSTGSANLLLQANTNNTSQQAGNYIGSEATGVGSAVLTFGRMIGGATTGGNAAKSEAMRIDSSGNLLVNSTTNLSTRGSNPKTFINAASGDTLGLQQSSNTVFNLYSYITTTSGTRYHCGFGDGTNNNIGYITTNGSSVTYATTSDYRLKENVTPMSNALQKVIALKPVTYIWKETGTIGEGFIAHELAEVCPDAVVGEKNGMRTEKYEISPAIPAELDEDGKVIKEAVEAVMGEREVPMYQGIDTSFLVATLTAAIQEQQVLINNLTTRLTTLEAK